MAIMRYWLSLFLLISSFAVIARPLTVAVAANFVDAFQAITQNYPEKMRLISGSSGTLYQQIRHGAPIDLFLSADSLKPQTLHQEKLGLIPQTYAQGKIVLFSKKPLTTKINCQLFAGKIAIANPQIAPYGLAAKQVLSKLNCWPVRNGKVILGQNISQTLLQVVSGAVDFGFISASQAKLHHISVSSIPNNWYQPIKQQLIVLNGQNQLLASKLAQFILSKTIQTQISKLGYQLAMNKVQR